MSDALSTDLVSFRAAGWLAAPDGESRASTTDLIQNLVSEIERLRREHEEDLARMQLATAAVEAANVERAGVTTHLKWLIDRVEWLKYEMDHGGDWKYLNLKREETAYCLEKFRAHIPALERLP